MDRLEYGVLLGISFFFGLIPMIFISLIKQKKEQVELSLEQKGRLVELGENKKPENGLISLVCGIHFLTVLFSVLPLRRSYNPFESVHIFVPLTYVLMISLLAYSSYNSSQHWIWNLRKYDFPQASIIAQEKHGQKMILGFGLTLTIFLIGWFVASKIELLKIILSKI